MASTLNHMAAASARNNNHFSRNSVRTTLTITMKITMQRSNVPLNESHAWAGSNASGIESKPARANKSTIFTSGSEAVSVPSKASWVGTKKVSALNATISHIDSGRADG